MAMGAQQQQYAMYAAANGQFPPAMQMQYYAAAQQMPMSNIQATHVPDFRFGAPQFMVDPQWQGHGEWEDEFDENGGAVLYGNLEVS